MNMHVLGRTGSDGAVGRSKGARIAVALLATAALCLGPAVAASADDAVDPAAVSDTAAAEVQAPVAEEVVEAPVVEEAAEEPAAPVEEVVVEEAVVQVAEEPTVSAEVQEPVSEATVAGEADATENDSSPEDAAEEDAGTESVDEADPVEKQASSSSESKKSPEENAVTSGGHQGIDICHATSSDSNPYNSITVDVDSIFGQNGHDSHTKAGGTRSDVIPAFWYIKNGNKHEYSYPGTGSYYPGKNLDATGVYMLQNNCDMPPEEPECPTVDLAPMVAIQGTGDSDCPKPPDDCWNTSDSTQIKGGGGHDNECPEPPDDCWYNDDSTQLRGEGGHDNECPEPPDDCWNDDDSPRMLSGDRRGSDCPEPPDDCWSDKELAQFKGGDGRDHECPEPPECPVYDSQELPSVQNADQARGGNHHDPECPKPPECPTPEDATAELQSADAAAKWDGGDKWECPKQPEISVDPGDCVTPTDGESEYSEGSESLVTGSNLRPGRDYLVTVTSGEGTVFSEVFEADGDGMVYAWVWISWPDTYTATISSTGHHQVSASTEFKIAECPPPLRPQLSATAVCVSGELQATLTGSDLAWEESYAVTVSGPSGFAWDGSLTGSEAGTAETTVMLGEAGNYVASMEGAANVEFTATKTCTENTVIVTKTPPALAETGASDENSTGGLLWMGLVAMVLAVGMMLEPTLRRRVKR